MSAARPTAPRFSALVLALALLAARTGLCQDSGVRSSVQPPVPFVPQPLEDPYEGRLVRELRLERPVPGQPGVTEPIDPALARLVRNNITTVEGTEFHADAVIEDAKKLNKLERFRRIDHQVQALTDGTVAVIFILEDRPIIQDIQPVGNHVLGDEAIHAIADRLIRSAVDDQQIDRVSREIEGAYRKKGYYRVRVEADQDELQETGILYFRVREGERLRVTDIRFTAVEGDLVFRPGELKSSEVGLKTHTYFPLFDKGLLDEEALEADVAALATFYRNHGYLDVRVDRAVTEAPNGREAIVEFLITAGRRYVLRSVTAYYPDRARIFTTREEAAAAAAPGEHILVLAANNVAVYTTGLYTSEQVAGLIDIKPGDVFDQQKIDRSERTVRDAYGKMGYTDALAVSGKGIVQVQARRDEAAPLVDLIFEIREGPRFKAGVVFIHGNPITRQQVIRHKVEVEPDHPLDTTDVRQSEANLAGARLFALGPPADSGRRPTITLQDPDPIDPTHRDVLVEVQETNTGAFTLSGSVSTDGGATLGLGLTQRNFDIQNPPDSWGELFSGAAFRGAGQTMSINLSPGTTYQTYSVEFTDPTLAETDYTLNVAGFYRFSNYSQYDEERYGGRVRLGRAFGSRWSGGLRLRNEWVALSDLDPDSPVDFFEVADTNRITGAELSFSKSSTPTYPRTELFVPTRGYRFEGGAEQVTGDFSFTKLRAQYAVYLPVYESFYGKTTVLSFSTRVNYIPQDSDDVPAYERYYLGGDNFRGFSFRAIGPHGIRNDTGEVGDTVVGGTWSFFAGTELRQPIPSLSEFLSVVTFIDSGTVLDTPGFDDYRVSIGAGLRITIPQLSEIPIAIDFGYPIVKQPGDDTRFLSFSIDVPFR